jgi:hypothetical protein
MKQDNWPPLNSKPRLTLWGRLLWADDHRRKLLCALIGHRVPRLVPASRVVYFDGVALVACDRCLAGVRVRPVQH